MNLTKEDIDALEDAAKKATPGPWCVQHPNAGVRGLEVADRTGLEQICADLTEPRARYIAAANPAVVLALINKVRELEQLNELLTKAKEHASSVVTGLMSRCLKAEDERDKLLQAAKQAAEEIRRCDYTPARSTLLVAIAQMKG